MLKFLFDIVTVKKYKTETQISSLRKKKKTINCVQYY